MGDTELVVDPVEMFRNIICGPERWEQRRDACSACGYVHVQWSGYVWLFRSSVDVFALGRRARHFDWSRCCVQLVSNSETTKESPAWGRDPRVDALELAEVHGPDFLCAESSSLRLGRCVGAIFWEGPQRTSHFSSVSCCRGRARNFHTFSGRIDRPRRHGSGKKKKTGGFKKKKKKKKKKS